MNPFRHGIGGLSFAFLALNLTLWGLVLIVLMLTRAILPHGRRATSSMMAGIYRLAVRGNDWWFQRILRIRCHYPELKLDRDASYIVIANHQSWADVFFIQSVLAHDGPIIKFLVKRELAYIPILGLIIWAFDFPMLRRDKSIGQPRGEQHANAVEMHTLKTHHEGVETKAGVRIQTKRPGHDRQRILDACRMIAESPSAVLSFVEGTRYTDSKHKLRPRFKNLLPPKVGGFSALCQGLRDQVTTVIDLTLIYPERATFWRLLCGAVRECRVDADVISIEDVEALGAPAWLNERWRCKDVVIGQARNLQASGVSLASGID